MMNDKEALGMAFLQRATVKVSTNPQDFEAGWNAALEYSKKKAQDGLDGLGSFEAPMEKMQ